MSDVEVIRKKIEELEKQAGEVERLQIEVVDSRKDPCLLSPSDPLKSKQREALRHYQQWYNAALCLVHEYLPSKEEEFLACYCKSKDPDKGVLDYLSFRRHIQYPKKYLTEFGHKFDLQRNILLSIPEVIEVQALSLRETLSVAFVEREIDEAEYLYRHDHIRAAGALAGVALEMHLRTICEKYGIEYGYKDTIEPLLQNLYKNKKIDVTELKRIQFLASIRDKCDHASDVEKGEVKELIEKVKTFVSRPA